MGSFVINPEDPMTHLPTDPDDDYQVSVWGERTNDHSGMIVFGVPDEILLGGNKFPDDNIRDPETYDISYHQFMKRTNTLRFEITQSSGSENLILQDINIQVIVSHSPTVSPTTSLPTSSPTTLPTTSPTSIPTETPTTCPTTDPTTKPTTEPTEFPTTTPTTSPSPGPTIS
eukprot:UN24577